MLNPSSPLATAGARRARRTQKQRSAETRALLLDVTVECLAELGYAGTTSKVVAERAGLSRGAQLHHFGTKAQLVTEALEHLFDKRFEEFRAGVDSVRGHENPTGAAFELLWNIMSGPSGSAYLELVCAARTDPVLLDAVVELNARMDGRVDALVSEVFEEAPGNEGFFEIGWTAVLALMEGLAFERIVRRDDARVPQVIEVLKQYAPALLRMKAGQSQDPPAGKER